MWHKSWDTHFPHQWFLKIKVVSVGFCEAFYRFIGSCYKRGVTPPPVLKILIKCPELPWNPFQVCEVRWGRVFKYNPVCLRSMEEGTWWSKCKYSLFSMIYNVVFTSGKSCLGKLSCGLEVECYQNKVTPHFLDTYFTKLSYKLWGFPVILWPWW